MYLLPGIAAFIFFIFFDLNKIYWKSKILNLFFAIGTVLLLFSTGYSIGQSDFLALSSDFGTAKILLLICTVFSIVLLIYALFFSLPFQNTYTQASGLPLINKGLYAACRHPGFWPFASFYFFLSLLFSSNSMFWCFITFTVCNFLYIVIQDKFVFPKYIQGYSQYKQVVPFLIPTKTSIHNAFKS